MGYEVVTDARGRPYRVAVVRTAKGVWVGWPGASAQVRAADRQAAAGALNDAVCAPMTGKVVQINVKQGQSVAEGEVLLLLEAMKMEYRLTAPHAGVVDKIACAQGAQVDLGDILVAFKK